MRLSAQSEQRKEKARIELTSAIVTAVRGAPGHFRTFITSVIAVIFPVTPEAEINTRHRSRLASKICPRAILKESLKELRVLMTAD